MDNKLEKSVSNDRGEKIIEILEHIKEYDGCHSHSLDGRLVYDLIGDGLIKGKDESEVDLGVVRKYHFNGLHLTQKGYEYLDNHYSKPKEKQEWKLQNIWLPLCWIFLGWFLGKLF